MKTVLSLFASISLLITTSVASVAQSKETVTEYDVAAQYCAAEWARVAEVQSDPQWPVEPIEFDPNIDAATTQALLKHKAYVLSVQVYIFLFWELPSEAYQNPELFDRARANFDLTKCLRPTEVERELVEVFSKTTTEPFWLTYFTGWSKTLDEIECLQIIEAIEAILSAEPFPVDVDAIKSAHMKDPSECE
ncbi:MAG: hypothetical protein ABJH45_08950 [Paracoccaceae bacterium]